MRMPNLTFLIIGLAVVVPAFFGAGVGDNANSTKSPRIAQVNLAVCFNKWRKEHAVPPEYQPGQTSESEQVDEADALKAAILARDLERWHAEDQRDFLKQLRSTLQEFCELKGVDIVVAEDEPLPEDDLFCGIHNSMGMRVIYVHRSVDATDEVISGLSSN
ncbi:MAG: hypothetical protein KDA69_09640 [Planctomycetaceae bacterium]|nr:hypothetical protein [Planctomycetaceae bacterium]